MNGKFLKDKRADSASQGSMALRAGNAGEALLLREKQEEIDSEKS